MAIEGFDDADFQELAPRTKGAASDLVVSTVTARQPGNVKVQFNLSEALLDEINAQGARFSIAYAPAKKAFRLKPEASGRFELITLPRGTGRHFLRTPLPSGLMEAVGKFEPEYFVDVVGRQIIVECPEELRHQAKLLAPPAPTLPAGVRGPLESASIAPPRHPGVPVDDEKITAAFLGLSGNPPTEIGGERFKPAEALVVELFSKRERVTKQMILLATANPEAPGEDERDEKLADVYLCKVRPKLASLGLTVKTHWGDGYSMSAADRQKLRNLIELARMEAEGE